jgi:beta-galactosidase
MAQGEIQVDVAGGALLALGNACSYNQRGYQTNTTDTYYGEGLAIIAPTGDVTIKAVSRYGTAQTTIPWKQERQA